MELLPFVKQGLISDIEVDTENWQSVLASFGASASDTPINVEFVVNSDDWLGTTELTKEGIEVKVALMKSNDLDAGIRKPSKIQKAAVHELSHVADMLDPKAYFREQLRYHFPRRGIAYLATLGVTGLLSRGAAYLTSDLPQGGPISVGATAAIAAGSMLVLKPVLERINDKDPTELRANEREKERPSYPLISVR